MGLLARVYVQGHTAQGKEFGSSLYVLESHSWEQGNYRPICYLKDELEGSKSGRRDTYEGHHDGGMAWSGNERKFQEI